MKWNSQLRIDLKSKKERLEDWLNLLVTTEPNDDTLLEMTNIRLQLKLEVDKEERY